MVSIQVYSDHRFALKDVALEDLANLRSDPTALLWIDLNQPSPEEAKKVLEEIFAFHPLAVEDCLADSPYPKVETYDDCIYIVLHVLTTTLHGFGHTELDVFMGKGYLLTYHREPLPAVENTFNKYARAEAPLVRGPDRFLHSVFDQIVNEMKPQLEPFRKSVEQVQEGVLANVPAEELFPKVIKLRKETARLRQFLRPQHSIATDLANGKHKLVRSTLLPYFRDLAEDIGRIELETAGWAEQLILSFRIYLNKSTHDANAGIRILTGITALTFPMLMVGGWFGMNFENMHELHTREGYMIALGLMLAGTVATAFFMRRKHWL